MNWYLAKIVYRIVCENKHIQPQFDEQVRLVKAVSEAEAIERASEIGKQEETCFTNNQLQLVQWSFINVCEIYCLADDLDGAEIVSTLREVTSAGEFIKLVNDKAAQIRQNAFCRQINLN